MKTKLLTQRIKTGDITLTSNLTSITVNGVRMSRVEEIAGHEQEAPSTIYLDLMVQSPPPRSDILPTPDVLEATEEVDLVLNLEDAVELGMFLVAMGMEHRTDEDVKTVMARLSDMIAEYR